MVSWGIREQLQVIGSVFVVGGDIEGHEAVEEGLAGRMEGEQSVPVHMVTGVRKGVCGCGPEEGLLDLQLTVPGGRAA